VPARGHHLSSPRDRTLHHSLGESRRLRAFSALVLPSGPAGTLQVVPRQPGEGDRAYGNLAVRLGVRGENHPTRSTCKRKPLFCIGDRCPIWRIAAHLPETWLGPGRQRLLWGDVFIIVSRISAKSCAKSLKNLRQVVKRRAEDVKGSSVLLPWECCEKTSATHRCCALLPAGRLLLCLDSLGAVPARVKVPASALGFVYHKARPEGRW
jgi:hypothetical protein